jgi:hypothetical protein
LIFKFFDSILELSVLLLVLSDLIVVLLNTLFLTNITDNGDYILRVCLLLIVLQVLVVLLQLDILLLPTISQIDSIYYIVMSLS